MNASPVLQLTPETDPGSEKTYQRLWIAGLVLAAALRVGLIERHGLWNNELITWGVIKLPTYGDLIRERLAMNHMPLYFIAEKAFCSFFGTGEWAMRAIGVLFGWMAVWATGRLARRIGGLRLAVPVVFAAAMHQIWMNCSIEARMYSILMWSAAEATDAHLAWVRAPEGDSGTRSSQLALARWSAVSILGIYNHMLFAPVFFVHLVDVACRRKLGWNRLRDFGMAVAVMVAASLPIALAWMNKQTKFEKDAGWDWKGATVLYRQTQRQIWGDYDTLDWHWVQVLGVVLLAVLIWGFARAYRRSGVETRRDLLTLIIPYLLYLPAIYVAAARSDTPILGQERYYVAFDPALLVVAWFVILDLPHALPRLGRAAAVASFAFLAAFTAADYAGPGEGLREAIARIGADARPGQGLIWVGAGSAARQGSVYYAKSLPKDILVVNRDESAEARLGEIVEGYVRRHPEFWLLTYHAKNSPIQKVLKSKRETIAPTTEELRYGLTSIQRFGQVTR